MVQAGQLGVMEALLECLTLHKGNENVVESVAGAFTNICVNGNSFVPVSSISEPCTFAEHSSLFLYQVS